MIPDEILRILCNLRHGDSLTIYWQFETYRLSKTWVCASGKKA